MRRGEEAILAAKVISGGSSGQQSRGIESVTVSSTTKMACR